MIYQWSVTAANCAVNNDLLDHSTSVPMKFVRNQPMRRIIDAIAFTGSTAIADTQIEMRIGGKTAGILINSGLTTHDKDNLFPIGTVIPPGLDFELIVVDAALTNPVYITILIRNV